jgi:hypothetical protein
MTAPASISGSAVLCDFCEERELEDGGDEDEEDCANKPRLLPNKNIKKKEKICRRIRMHSCYRMPPNQELVAGCVSDDVESRGPVRIRKNWKVRFEK